MRLGLFNQDVQNHLKQPLWTFIGWQSLLHLAEGAAATAATAHLTSPSFYINSFEISRKDRGDPDRYADKDAHKQSLDTLIYS